MNYWRGLWRYPGYTIIATVLISLAVGLNAAVAGALWALSGKALPYREDGRLVELRLVLPKIDFRVDLSRALYAQVRGATDTFVGAIGSVAKPAAKRDEVDRPWVVHRVTRDFASQLGVAPMLGRAFAEHEPANTLVLSDRAWRAYFDASPDALGRELRIAGASYQVIGVMPRGFAYPDAQADAWMADVETAAERERGGFGDYTVAARLAPGVSVAQAQARFEALLAQADLPMLRSGPENVRAEARPWRERFSGRYLRPLTLLQYGALLLLVVVCMSLLMLALHRLQARAAEFAIRRTLGAGTREVFAAMLGELWPAAVLGLVLGLVFVAPALGALTSLGLLPIELPVAVGGDAMTWGVGMATVIIAMSGVLVGALVIARASARTGMSHLRGRQTRQGRGPALLVLTQIALTTALMGGAGLLLRSATQLWNEPRGFEAEGLVLTQYDMVNDAIPESTRDALANRLRDAIATLPGARAVATGEMPPFANAAFIAHARLPGEAETRETRGNGVSANYFQTLATPLLRGRAFEAGDEASAAPVAVIDETFRAAWFGERDPVGAAIEVVDEDGKVRALRVIGVVASVKQNALDEGTAQPMLYEYRPGASAFGFVITRVDGDVGAMAEAIRKQVAQVSPDVGLAFHRPMAEIIAQTLQERRALLAAMMLFAVAALVLAAVGLYGVIGVATRARLPEFGVRMALGATAGRILRLVLGSGARLIVAGVVVGLIAGVPLARLLVAQMYGLSSSDPLTWLGASALVGGVALLACALPARRAARLNPREAIDQLGLS